jgi:hydroxymethylbilane synthase
MAGLLRAGLFDASYMAPLDPERGMLPAPARGALALQCRRDDARTRDVLAALNDPDTAACVAAERAVVAALNGDCHSPIAALATIEPAGREMHLRAAVAGRDGQPPVVRASSRGPAGDGDALVAQVVKLLFSRGATPGTAPPV